MAYRLWLPIWMFNSSVVLLRARDYLSPVPSFSAICGLFGCLFLLHATCIFGNDLVVYLNLYPLRSSAHKLGSPLRPRVPLHVLNSGISTPRSMNRLELLGKQLLEESMLYTLRICVTLLVAYPTIIFFEEDSQREHLTCLRGFIWLGYAPPITAHEFICHFFLTYAWIATSYQLLGICRFILSIFFVWVLEIDSPQQKRSVFVNAQDLARKLLPLRPASPLEDSYIALWTFILSIMCQSIVDSAVGHPYNPTGHVIYTWKFHGDLD